VFGTALPWQGRVGLPGAVIMEDVWMLFLREAFSHHPYGVGWSVSSATAALLTFAVWVHLAVVSQIQAFPHTPGRRPEPSSVLRNISAGRRQPYADKPPQAWDQSSHPRAWHPVP
jgi:hypothetical protein